MRISVPQIVNTLESSKKLRHRTAPLAVEVGVCRGKLARLRERELVQAAVVFRTGALEEGQRNSGGSRRERPEEEEKGRECHR